MNYKLHYQNLISKYGLSQRPKESWRYERHHILPKSLGGSNSPENLVYLTGRQHFLAHWLLFKIHNNDAMAMAFFLMRVNKSNYIVTACEAKSAERAMRVRGMMSKAVKTPLGVFASYRDAAAAHNMPESTFQDLLRRNQSDFVDLGQVRRIVCNGGGKHGMARRVKTPLGFFDYVGAAAKAHGVSNKQIARLCENYPDDYFYLDPPKQKDSGRDQTRSKRAIMTPKGVFDSTMEAAVAFNLSRDALRHRLRSEAHADFYFIE